MENISPDNFNKDGLLFSLPPEDRDAARDVLWDECVRRAFSCEACGLSRTRKSVVFGDGSEHTELLFIGEGPGADEDEQGRPFVGKAGQLLTQILTAAGIDREDVYITNVVKCRPPDNRLPQPDEMTACDLFLQAQIQLLSPSIIVLLGSTPTKWLLKTTEGITKLRGRWYNWRGTSVMPMFHPSYLLRFPDGKKPGSPKRLTWQDIQEVKRQWDSLKTAGAGGDSVG
ncbi:MAG: uracil-DNA glycosylase [Synergistaceae bacterium]|jgi:DNA polymerase|nr:uracil-DNA glycosylase [Synergistaceae bacterium]